MNTRPVRFAPFAAGASPTTSSRARGSPKPGTGRAQYVWPVKRFGTAAAAASRQRTSRAHLRQPVMSEVSVRSRCDTNASVARTV